MRKNAQRAFKRRQKSRSVVRAINKSAHAELAAKGLSFDTPDEEKKIFAFYDSWEWKRVRYEFIKDKERKCNCCGATPKNGVRIVVDHIKPIRHFWNLRMDSNNLQILCDDCNMGKGSSDQTDWR